MFVTGVSTGVGKTYFSLLFLRRLRKMKLRAFYFKPVETGGERPEDYILCSSEAFASVAPVYHFRNPVSPHLAAAMEGREIDVTLVETTIRSILEKDLDIVVVEGAGGILVPITPTWTWADLLERLRIPILIVSSSYLGVLNHTLLTLEVARSRGIRVVGVVLNFRRRPATLAENTNESALRELIGELFLGKISYRQKILATDVAERIISRIREM